MDFVIPLPRSRRGNTALLLWQCSFTGFVIAKAMSDTDALTVAKVFEEGIYRRYGDPSLFRHDRDPRFMSEVFQAFAELINTRSRSTLSYHPQAHGQQVWSVKIVMQSVKVYVEDPLQQDWDEIAERTEALAWWREINRQQQIALVMAKEYQAVEKARRARIHNEKLSRKEQAAVSKSVNDDAPDVDSEPKSLFRPGSR
ncbi:reverse transcriptase, partial [Phytophthora megakarya]